TSQLNHATVLRQPGSVFKPLVYAAGMATALEGGSKVFTPASMLNDEEANFRVAGVDYMPHDFHGESGGGMVSTRYALIHSLNIPAVSLATAVGLNRVVQIAQRMGLNGNIKATPAVALGAYETTPLEIAAAYTAFANQGSYVGASLVSEMRDSD